MKRTLLLMTLALLLSGNAFANNAFGNVYCDAQPNGLIDGMDTPLAGVGVSLEILSSGIVQASTLTDANGFYFAGLPAGTETYEAILDPVSLPADAVIVEPSGGTGFFTTNDQSTTPVDFLVDSASCREPPQDGCWMTGGGVKFEPLVGSDLARHGPKDTMGGVVYPSCDPDPSNGGQWNHVAHSVKAHYQAFDINTVRCGNVADHPPGSESPVTPFNFIEWEGTGRMQGIKGNKSSFDVVHFFGRAEDRNEPGSEGPAEGGDIDRYFLHAWVIGAGGTPVTLFCVDEDGDCSTVDPRTISGGNLQLHYSSCE